MAQKQLEIIVSAKDQASSVLRGVGDAAQQTGNKIGSYDDLVGQAKGFKSTIKTVKSLALAYEVLPLGLEAVKASYTSIFGTAEEAAGAQRDFFNTIKSFPIVGKIVGPAAEALSAKLAHLFGRQSTAEAEAEFANRKRILEDFAKTAEKLSKESGKLSDEAALLGLTPSAGQIEKAKQKYRDSIEELNKAKRAITEAAGQGKDVSVQTDQLAKAQGNAKRLELAEIAVANAKRELEEQAFTARIVEAYDSRKEKLAALTDSLHSAILEADNRGYEAQNDNIKAQLDRQLLEIGAAYQKQRREIEKQITELEPLARQGNQSARSQIGQLRGEDEANRTARAEQEASAKLLADVQQRIGREETLRQIKIATLQVEADAGSLAAKAQLERLNSAREIEATEKALQAIARDETATAQQRKEAEQQIAELKTAQALKATAAANRAGDEVRDSGLFILQQQALLGDKLADQQAKKLEIEKQYAEERKKLLAIIQSEAATEEQKVNAKKLLGDLGTVEQRALDKVGRKDSTQPELATLDASQYLRGVSASAAQERDQYQPVVDAQNKHIDVSKDIRGMIEQYIIPFIIQQGAPVEVS